MSAKRSTASCDLSSSGSAAQRKVFEGTFESANGGPCGQPVKQSKKRVELQAFDDVPVCGAWLGHQRTQNSPFNGHIVSNFMDYR